jgi:response regulator RpfG family c-di-GMP phosphodiesterase
MEQEQLDKLKSWFDDYVAKYYADDEYVNANLKLKEDHSRRTCEEILYLADELGLDANRRRIAAAAALFHDIGRFEQFIRHQTYNDPRSVNHCLLGLEVLRDTRAFDNLQSNERELVEKAIEYHGLRELPEDLDDEVLLFSRLIRDADKLDVFYVVVSNYQRYRENPDQFLLEIELPDGPDYSPDVVADIMHARLIDYHRLRTLNDMKLMQLGWVYDVNFTATLKRIKQRGFLQTLAGFLPETDDIKKLKEKIFAYVDSKIAWQENRNRDYRQTT